MNPGFIRIHTQAPLPSQDSRSLRTIRSFRTLRLGGVADHQDSLRRRLPALTLFFQLEDGIQHYRHSLVYLGIIQVPQAYVQLIESRLLQGRGHGFPEPVCHSL